MIRLCLAILVLCSLTTYAQTQRTVIAVSYLLDGKGHVLRNTRIVVEGSKIVASILRLNRSTLICVG